MSLGKVLKLIRIQRNMSQGEMSNFIGVTQNFLSQVENNKRDISLGKIADIANKLNISKETLIIAGSDVPDDFEQKKKNKFIEMQNYALQLILMGH